MKVRIRRGPVVERRAERAFDELGPQVREALAHLHDVASLESCPLAGAFPPLEHRTAGESIRVRLIDAIESLRPEPEVALDGRAARRYRLLELRLLENRSTRQVQEILAISNSEYHRLYAQCVEAIAARLRLPRASRAVPGLVVLADHVAAPSTNLPRQLTTFVGREREIADVECSLGQAPVVTIVGPPGSGKTRLAQEAAAAARSAYSDGTWFVDLTTVTEPTLVAGAVAVALGVREVSGASVVAGVIDFLRPRRALVILDNCEQVIDACAELAQALGQSCDQLQLLVTSREPLAIAGEVVRPIPPLATPPEPDPRAPELGLGTPANDPDGERYAAVRLFVERAKAIRPDFALTAENADSVAQICRQVDGLPLAIELVAARVAILTPVEIAERLGDAVGFLVDGRRTSQIRQRTLRALLEWSYLLLSEPERAALRRLAVFRGTFDLDAAIAVVSDETLGEAKPSVQLRHEDILDLMGQLVRKSLVTPVFDPHGGRSRYRLLETIRQYAAEKLEQSGEADLTGRRHRDYFLDLAARAEPFIWGSGVDQVAWLDRLERDHANLRAAIAWSQKHDPETGGILVRHLLPYARIRQYGREAHGWGEALRQRLPGDTPGGLGARVVATMLAHVLHDQQQGLARSRELLSLARARGDRQAEALALLNLGTLARDQGLGCDARRHFEDCLAICRDIGFGWGIGWVLGQLSEQALSAGDIPRAAELARESLELLRRIGNRRGAAIVALHLGELRWRLSDVAGFRDATTAAAKLAGELGGTEGLYLGFVAASRLRALRVSGDRPQRLASLIDRSLVLRPGSAPAEVLPHYLLAAAEDVLATRPEVGRDSSVAETATLLAAAAEAHASPRVRLDNLAEVYAQGSAILGETAFASAQRRGKSLSLPVAVSLARDALA
jgi:non-specific serine/threonine protein kinase